MVCKYLPTEAPSPEAVYRILCNGNMLGTASNVQRVPNIFPWGHHCKWVWCFPRFLYRQDTPCNLPHQSRYPAVTLFRKVKNPGPYLRVSGVGCQGTGFRCQVSGVRKEKKLKPETLFLVPCALHLVPFINLQSAIYNHKSYIDCPQGLEKK